MNDPAHDNITHAWRNLAALASGIIPAKVHGEADHNDAANLIEDLELLAAKVDALIEAYGEYGNSIGILSKSDIKDCFKDVLKGALNGNADYLIENGVKERQEYLADEAAEHRAAMRRERVA